MINSNAYYINIFRDQEGQLQHSEGGVLNSEYKALREATIYVLDHGWTYIDTLSNNPHFVHFGEKIKDAEFERDHPGYECTRQQYEEMVRKQMEEVCGIPFRPQPTRGIAPTNPATRAGIGDGI